MSTAKRRLNVTLPKTTDVILTRIARRDGVPTATKAKELLELALEIEEDKLWDELALVRDTNQDPLVSHKEAWV